MSMMPNMGARKAVPADDATPEPGAAAQPSEPEAFDPFKRIYPPDAAPEGERASGAGVEDWRSTTISAEIASLRADRDRLEREIAHTANENDRLDDRVKRLERELEEARRERDEAIAIMDANLEELDHRREENCRLRETLTDIATASGAFTDLASYMRQHAKRALSPATDSEDGDGR